MDTQSERKKAVARLLGQARHDRAQAEKRDISKRDQAVWLGLSDKTYGLWEDGARMPDPKFWQLLVSRFGPEMALALGLPSNVSIEALQDIRFVKIAAWWPTATDREREVLIAIAEKTAGSNPEMKRFLTELLAAA